VQGGPVVKLVARGTTASSTGFRAQPRLVFSMP
jgi:hypothetical protein